MMKKIDLVYKGLNSIINLKHSILMRFSADKTLEILSF